MYACYSRETGAARHYIRERERHTHTHTHTHTDSLKKFITLDLIRFFNPAITLTHTPRILFFLP